MRRRRFIVLLLAAGLLWALAASALAQERVALVIGNASYAHQKPLRNPPNDAAAISASLRRLGFKVTRLDDAGKRAMERGLQMLMSAARGSEIALVFYAGHGIEVDQRNFLVPVDARLASDQDVEFETVSLALVMRAVGRASRLGLVILDACRDNPFAVSMQRSGATRTIGRGLARVEPKGQTLVAYAAKEGTTADDGDGRNSPFTTALLRHLEEPGLEVLMLFRRVRDAVLASTGEGQEPVIYGSLSSEGIYLKAGTTPSPPPVASVGPDPAAEMWAVVKASDDPADVRDFLEAYPDSVYAPAARVRCRQLQCMAEHQAERHRQEMEPGQRFRDCPECPEMVVVPAGSFRMGSPASEAGHNRDEGPVHRVTILEPLAVGVHEVTRGEFARFVRETNRSMGNACWVWDSNKTEGAERSGRNWRNPGFTQSDRHPVVCVNWDDAQAYVRWLSGKTKQRYRLLSESEWEYVARAGTTSPFHTGSTISTDQANYNGNYTYGTGRKGEYRKRTVEVGSFSPNAFGLHDVLGNVWEWTQDCWNDSYGGAPGDGRAWQEGNCNDRRARGGSWPNFPVYLRSAYRNRATTGNRSNVLGFRIARTLTP